ncbi:hypothetical protein TWF281_011205 [Arthrobotrys megalospora]
MQLIVLSTAIFAAIQTVSAHGSIKYPKPILFDENRNNYNAPLDPSFANFPCKGFHNQPFNAAATWKAGQEAHFEIDMSNIAAHGGGSCQASISHDGGKTFEVLHSFIGDCPRGANGNSAGSDQIFKFMIPKDEPAGEAIFAWTWFAAIARREMYMNCAFVTIENDSPATQVSSRPPMFVGLLGEGGTLCTVGERDNLQFPEPGKFVTDGTQNPTAQFKSKALPSGPQCGNAETGGGEPIQMSLPPNKGLVGGPVAGPKPAPVNPVPVIEEPTPTTTAVVTPPMQSTTLNVVYVTKTLFNPVVAVVTVTATEYVPGPTGSSMAKRHEHVARDQSCTFQETMKIGNECPVPSTTSSQWQDCVWKEFCPCLDDNLSPFDIVNFSQIKGHCDCLTKGIGCTGGSGLRTRHMRRHMDLSGGVDIILRRDEDPMIHTFKA